MAKNIEDLVEAMRNSPWDVRFADACKVATHYFGKARTGKGSHVAIWKMPWAGDPRINLQEAKGGRAKSYQVAQLIAAIDRSVADAKTRK